MTADLEQFRWLLEQVDRNLTGRPDLEVQWAEEPNGPWGYCEGPRIQLDPDVVANWVACPDASDGLSCLLGLNFHELGHVLFSPDADKIHSIWDWTHSHVWNLLEDQRIERRVIERYPASKANLTALALELVNESTEPAELEPFLIGRDHLPDLARRMTKSAFVLKYGRPAHRRLRVIVDEYVSLTDVETTRMSTLVEDLHGLLMSIGWLHEPGLESWEVAEASVSAVPLEDFDFEANFLDDPEYQEESVADSNEIWDALADEWFRVDVREHKGRAA